jgi:hypothetical protein
MLVNLGKLVIGIRPLLLDILFEIVVVLAVDIVQRLKLIHLVLPDVVMELFGQHRHSQDSLHLAHRLLDGRKVIYALFGHLFVDGLLDLGKS